MEIPLQHEEKLDFIRNYYSTLEHSAKFSANQLWLRETAKLKGMGLTGDDRYSEERLTDVQLFSIDVIETMRSQMVLIIWTYFENLFDSTISVLSSYRGIPNSFKKKEKVSIVKCWKNYLSDVLKFHSGLSDNDWQKLADLLHVRNFIAHNTHKPGISPREAQLKAAKRQDGIIVDHRGVTISSEFIVSNMDFARQLLCKLGGDHWVGSNEYEFLLPE